MSEPAKLIPPKISAVARDSRRFPVAFGRRFFLLLLIGLVWLGPAWQDKRFLYGMAAWDILVLAFWLWDLRRLPRAGELLVERSWTSAAGLATPVSVQITLVNSSPCAVQALVVDDVPAALRRELPAIPLAVPARGRGCASYIIEPCERGDARLGNASFRYQSQLEVAERWATAEVAQTVRIYPNLEQAKRTTIHLIRSRRIELQRRRQSQRGLGREFDSLRDYHQGDEYRDICWTASARRGKPISKVYRAERSQTVWLVIDAGRRLRARAGGLSKLDHAADAALTLAQIALYSGDQVALLAYGRQIQQRVAPGRGTAHLRALVESLALVCGEAHEADHFRAVQALMGTQKRRSLVVWLTDLAEAATTPEVVEAASRLMHRHLLLFVVIGQQELRELARRRPGDAGEMYRCAAAQELVLQRELLLRQLNQHGAMAIETEAARLAMELVSHYIRVKERRLL